MQTATQPRSGNGATETQTVGSLDDVIQHTQRTRAGVTLTAAARLGVTPDKLFGLLRNVWATSQGQADLTDQELFAGVSMIARFELDPISREVYVSRDNKGRLMTIVGLDGWIKILDRTDHYDGFDQELGFDASGKTLEWVETKIYSTKRSHPAVYRAYATEYARLGGFVSKTLPWHMLRIFSLRHAARLFVPLGGNVVSEEEAAWMLREGERHISAETSPDRPGLTKSQQVAERLKARAGGGTAEEERAADATLENVRQELAEMDAKKSGETDSQPQEPPLTPERVDEELAKAACSGRRTDVVEVGNELHGMAIEMGDAALKEYVFEAVERVCGGLKKTGK